MERWLTAARRIAPFAPVLAIAGLLSACDDGVQPPPATSAAATTAQPAAPPPPSQTAVTTGSDASSAGVLPNDPSAPANTPLCGIAAQENNAMTRQLLPRQYAQAGQCTAYACYDVATATYIGADGFRHVCR